MPLNTRKPTGVVPWPLILIEGGEKTGQSDACAVLSASSSRQDARLDWGEGAAMRRRASPAPATRSSRRRHVGAHHRPRVAAAKEEAQRAKDAGEPPVVLVLDSITCEWESLKDWASDRAKTTSANRASSERTPTPRCRSPSNLAE